MKGFISYLEVQRESSAWKILSVLSMRDSGRQVSRICWLDVMALTLSVVWSLRTLTRLPNRKSNSHKFPPTGHPISSGNLLKTERGRIFYLFVTTADVIKERAPSKSLKQV